ncbi:MAG: hypothetical protein BWY82_02037 [Verrucomicrobia bacterium ADurb.Bin474]|nr:MAG: hypothetical protein BWY82_02037 [Verrucomicrobia bacterium ADurb.Bin474]
MIVDAQNRKIQLIDQNLKPPDRLLRCKTVALQNVSQSVDLLVQDAQRIR